MVTGHCSYEYNPTERYQHRDWGTHCGRTTYAGFEVIETPKLVNGEVEIVKTVSQRDQADPWCPLHGGTKNPRPPIKNTDPESVPNGGEEYTTKEVD